MPPRHLLLYSSQQIRNSDLRPLKHARYVVHGGQENETDNEQDHPSFRPERRHADRRRQVSSLSQDRPARPDLAVQGHRQGADLVLGRPARRQPVARRPDGPRPQGAHVPAAARHGLQGNRNRLPLGVADRF
ncbi:protein of unknown function [Aminobacter niigataensis]|nr:protein of unknown function [Aminobacter niigataensis]